MIQGPATSRTSSSRARIERFLSNAQQAENRRPRERDRQRTHSRDATQRATAIWQTALANYQQPPLDPAIVEALDAFVARRKEELRGVDH